MCSRGRRQRIAVSIVRSRENHVKLLTNGNPFAACVPATREAIRTRWTKSEGDDAWRTIGVRERTHCLEQRLVVAVDDSKAMCRNPGKDRGLLGGDRLDGTEPLQVRATSERDDRCFGFCHLGQRENLARVVHPDLGDEELRVIWR